MFLCNLLRRSPLYSATKRCLRVEPPLHALRRDPNSPRLFSSLVGKRPSLHDRVQSLIRASDLDAASRLARQSEISEFSSTPPTVSTCNAIIAAMYRAKRYSESISLFQYFFDQSNIVPNLVSYNLIINAHCDQGRVEKALQLYRNILANAPFAPSSVTYRHLTKGLVQAGRIGDAESLLREMLSKGQAADSMVYNNLIRGYLDLGDLDKADELFDELKSMCKVSDGIVNATFMEYWFEQGKDKEAMESYRSLLDKKFRMHPPTGNVLLEVFLKYGKKTEASALFSEMLDNHTLNSETVNIMVNECFKMGQFSAAIDTFKKVGTKLDYVCYSNIVTRFCEQEMLPEAETFFAEGLTKGLHVNAPSHRAMIDAYLKAERFDDALKILNRMVDVNLRVVSDFGTRVFGVLIKNGKLTESAEVLTKMGEREPKPDLPIYDVVVRGLCDGGALDQAKNIIAQMVGHGLGVSPILRELIIEAERFFAEGLTKGSEDNCFEINSIAKAAALISPSVVNLQTTKDLYGSGILINEKGRIITCAHNVLDLEKFKRSQVYQSKSIEVKITLSDGQKFRGTVCDCDSDYDLALIKLEASKMSFCPAKFGAASDASVGDWVVSVGNAMNYANTVSNGIIRLAVMVGELAGDHGGGRRRRRRWPVTVVTCGRGGWRRWGWK